MAPHAPIGGSPTGGPPTRVLPKPGNPVVKSSAAARAALPQHKHSPLGGLPLGR